MVVYVGNSGAMRKWWWYAEVDVDTGTKNFEIWMENGAVDGSDAARGTAKKRVSPCACTTTHQQRPCTRKFEPLCRPGNPCSQERWYISHVF